MKHEKLKWKLVLWIFGLDNLDMLYDLEIIMDEYEEKKEEEGNDE
jgi:hypothetical protein